LRIDLSELLVSSIAFDHSTTTTTTSTASIITVCDAIAPITT
jgi:hypothetical protein